jgi:putative ABC transport system permease protein
LGIIISELVGKFGDWSIVITWASIFLSFVFLAAVGFFFGWYPARKAASLQPIEALRYE